MAVFKTLDDLNKKIAKPKKAAGSGERVDRFFTVKDGEQFRIRFRQELTEDGANFDAEAGTFELVNVHSSPTDFRLNAICTNESEEDGYQCWACEQTALDKGWYPKQHLLINVAVQNPDTKVWEPRVLDQKLTSAHVGADVIEFYTEYGTLLDREYRISRTGTSRDTNYMLMPLGNIDLEDETATTIKELPMHDLDRVFRKVAYGEQEAFYTGAGSEDKGGAAGWTD